MINRSNRQERLFTPLLSTIKSWSQQFQRHQFLALGFSLAAHLVLGLLFKHGGESQNGASSRPATAPIVVAFVKPEGAGSALSIRSENPVDPTDFSSAAPQQWASSPLPEKPLFPIYRSTKPHYFGSKDLTEKPLVLRDIPPDVGHFLEDVAPQSAVVRLLINEGGEVDQIMLEKSALPQHAERLLRDVFSKVKFHPGKIDGIAVKSQVKIEVAIEPAATASPDSNRSLAR